MCRIEDIKKFHGSLTFGMVKMFQNFESRSYGISKIAFISLSLLSWKCYRDSFALGYVTKCAELKTLPIFTVRWLSAALQ